MKKFILLLFVASLAQAQTRSMTEDDYYRIVTLPIPQNISLEVGGLAVLPDGRLAASTRRGEVWLISNPYMKGSGQPTYKRFAHGLHEPLGLMYRNNYFLLSQRGEITKLTDGNNDDVADSYESFYKWPLSGNYHEYSYGPVEGPNGELYVTLNLGWVGRGASLAKWRGWLLKFNDKAEMTPIATGLRSPAGYLALKSGEVFYAENQGDWVGSGRITHLEKGDFAGNPAGLKWTSEMGSPLAIKPSDVPDTGEPMYDVAKRLPNLKPATVWFPHTLMGISTSDMVEDNTNGGFGPFAGQVFVGDQGHSKIMRMCLEKVNGKWQGACFPFREGFQSGILRMAWGLDGSMFVGQTSRGWSATGTDPFGIQRLAWTGQTPFEMKTIKSTPDGFEIAFTQPADRKTASDVASYKISSFTYKYHHTYGSPIINTKELNIKYIQLSVDGLKARIVLDSLHEGYIHEIKAEGVNSDNGQPLLHNFGYYTLNSIAKGEKLNVPASAAMNHSTHNMPAVVNNKVEADKLEKTNVVATANLKRITEAPAEWKNAFDQVVILGTKPGLKFDVSEVQVKAGSHIKWIFNNNDDMLHNCVITGIGTANYVGETAIKLGLKGADMQYVPNSKNVLFHTNILQPESSETIYFTAPSEVGEYPFLCTFPGHHTLMVGKLKVVK
jgi:azurin/glucose/arabinose dehydrogenase